MSALIEALAQGGKVEWDGENHPQLLIPPGMREGLERERPFVQAAMRRAAIFRAQLSEAGGFPFFHLPEARDREPGEGECLSCAAPLPGGARWRCPLCQAAAWVVLGIMPSSAPQQKKGRLSDADWRA